MTYTINTATNEVTRVADGKIVAPCQSADDPDFVAYIAWVNANNTPAEIYDAPEPTITVPQAVTMRQARLAMLGANILHLVDGAIAAMASPAKEAAQINWEYASEVQRDDTLVGALASGLGMTSADVDALFIAAAEL